MDEIHCDICDAYIGQKHDPEIGRKTREHFNEKHPDETKQEKMTRTIRINGHTVEVNEHIEANSTCTRCGKTKYQCMTEPEQCKPKAQQTLF